MKTINLLFWVCLSLVTSLLDVSFFSAMPVYDATIVSTLAVILVLALVGNLRNEVTFSFSSIIFFSLFSSVPVWYLVIAFMIVPTLVLYLRKSHLPDLSVAATIPFFIGVNLLFQAGLIAIVVGGWGAAAWNSLGYFVLINTICGLVIYFALQNVASRLKRGKLSV